jgi:hypothetical protein
MITSNKHIARRLRTLLPVFILVFEAVAQATTLTPRDTVTTHVVVRQGPSTESPQVGALNPGETAELVESISNWQKVRIANCTVGYVSKRWVTETAAPGPVSDCGGSVTPTPTPNANTTVSGTPGAGVSLAPLLSVGHPVDWWFVFKLNAAKFPGCSTGATRQCPFGGDEKNYRFGLQYVYASSENPTLQQGTGCLGDTDSDPVGATFKEAYNGRFHYVVWNDQFYGDPKISGCGNSCSKPWGHSKGMVVWTDANEGFLMQVTTPSWPASGSSSAPRQSDGNTLGCIQDDNVEFSQHFFALRLNHDDIVQVLKGLQNSSIVTDAKNPQIVSNGGSSDIQELVNTLGRQSQSTTAITFTLSTGVQIISKPSSLHVPPWQMVSALLGAVPLRVATWWSSSKINSTVTTTSIGCWDQSPGTAGPVEIATTGQWNGKSFGLTGGVPSGDGNHAKIGVSTSQTHHYAIFGDMNQEGALSGNTTVCGGSQNGRGGLFFVVDNASLEASVADLIRGASAPIK